MPLNLTRLLAHPYTTRILTFGIIALLVIFITYQLLHHPADYSFAATHKETADSLNNAFSIRDWAINLVDKLNWQQEGASSYNKVINTLQLFVFLALATSIGLPRQIAALVAGIYLGAFIGAAIATLAATLGCFITFSVARYLLSAHVTRKYPSKIATLSNFLGDNTFLKAFVIRILPIGSNFLTNIIAGVSKVSMPAYVGGSFVGFIPQMIIFSLAGSGIRLGAQNELIASATLFVIAFVLTVYLVKKHKVKTLQQ